MYCDADLGAPAFDRTAAAKGRDRSAEMLTERNQQVIVIDPMPLRQLQPERHLGLIRSPGTDVTPAIRDAMDVRIDTDPRLFVANRDDQIGGLPTDAGKTEERLDRIGDATVASSQQVAADRADGPGLGLIKTDRVDRSGDL